MSFFCDFGFAALKIGQWISELILMFINRATQRQAPITAAWKIILNSWKLSGTNVIRAASAFGGLMCWMSFIVIWIAGIYIAAVAVQSFGDFQNLNPTCM